MALAASKVSMRLTAAPAAVCRPVSRVPAMLVEAKQGGGKLKTRKAAAKRYKVSGGGKVMARHPGKQHLNEKLDRESKVELSSMFVVHKGDIPNIIKCMPHAKIGGSH